MSLSLHVLGQPSITSLGDVAGTQIWSTLTDSKGVEGAVPGNTKRTSFSDHLAQSHLCLILSRTDSHLFTVPCYPCLSQIHMFPDTGTRQTSVGMND